MNLLIDTLCLDDLPEAQRLVVEAGWNQLDADWHRLLELWPRLCLAGRVENQLVATATLASFAPSLGWVGMVLVDRRFQKRGFGGAMLDAIIQLASTVGIQTLGLDATDQGKPIYIKRGFQQMGAIDRWIGPSQMPIPLTVTGSIQWLGMDNSHWPELLQLDQLVMHHDRSALLRHLAGETNVGVVASIHQNVLAGFAVVRPGRNHWHIGPIIARDDACAAALLDQVLQYVAGHQPLGEVILDVPRTSGLSAHLPSRHFRATRELFRMMKSSATHPQPIGDMNHVACSFDLG